MSPLLMDTGYEPNSPGSLSAEESQSNTPGSEREGEGQQTGQRATKRQEKNRDAARRSRKKQTERADELHEELQGLERSNSALQKEIASLKKELHLYTKALEHHEPFCCLRDSASSSRSSTHPEVYPSAVCQAGSSPPRVPPLFSTSTQAAAPSLSTSLTPSLGLQVLNSVESTHLSPSTPSPTTTTSASTRSSSFQPFTTSSAITSPYSDSFLTVPSSHSLFGDSLPSLITPRPTNVMPACTSLVSEPVPSSSLTTTAQLQSRQGVIPQRFSMSANACFSRLHPGVLEAPKITQASFMTASADVVPPYSRVEAENAGLEGCGCPLNVPQIHPDHFKGNPVNSSPPHSLLLSNLQDPALQSLSVSSQANPESCPASAFASKPSYSQHVVPSPASLLSLLTVPSPLDMSQTTSSIFDGPPSQPLPSLPPLGDPIRDLSLSEFLEVNDWILQ